jgi:ketosteroid isomerase-like protein
VFVIRQTKTVSFIVLATVLFTTACASARSASPESQLLFDDISNMDRAMFDAFNAHDAEKLATFFSEDLEFYHDTGGLLTKSVAMDGMKSNFAKNNGLRRDLVKDSLEVYRIKGYGAVEIGAHRFCHVENGRDDCGVFRFVHVWQKKDGTWKITRAVSYDH